MAKMKCSSINQWRKIMSKIMKINNQESANGQPSGSMAGVANGQLMAASAKAFSVLAIIVSWQPVMAMALYGANGANFS
jgi:hypothetical protein